jgi:AbiV family abortive infection protein
MTTEAPIDTGCSPVKLVSMAIDPTTLLEGTLKCLRISRTFQRDAVELHDRSQFVSAVVLSTISFEHSATATWLHRRYQHPKDAASITPKDVNRFLNGDHTSKLAGGVNTYSLRLESERADQIINEQAEVPRDSARYTELNAEMDRIREAAMRQFPRKLHRLRTAAQYITFDKRTKEWAINETTPELAYFVVMAAGNNYGNLSRILLSDDAARKMMNHLGIYDEVQDLSRIWPSAETKDPATKMMNEISRLVCGVI